MEGMGESATAEECLGRLEMELMTIDTASDSLESSVIFHIVIDILGFVLYMHHQIPSVLQDISLEFDELQNEHKNLEMVVSQAEMKASLRRKHVSRKREVKQGIKRLEKLMNTIANFRTALQLLITEMPQVERLILVLGPSPLRPLHLYEICFSHGRIISRDFSRTKVADAVSRKKAIRTLISRGAGSNRDSYAGPSKLFLLAKAPSSLNLPHHFLPKRDFRYNKKIVPFKLLFKSRSEHVELNAQCADPQSASSMLTDSVSDINIWFQCRHIVKGLASKALSTEE